MKVLGIGQVMVDIIYSVDEDFLAVHNLEPNDQIIATTDNHAAVFENLPKSAKFKIGGGTLNMIRSAKHVNNKNICVFTSSIGSINDHFTKFVKNTDLNGIETLFFEVDNQTTAKDVCLLSSNGKNRSIVTSLGAAKFLPDDLARFETAIQDEYNVVYIAGYFTNVVDCEKIFEIIERLKVGLLATNLSAKFLVRHQKTRLNALLKKSDIIFGNKDEAIEWYLERHRENVELQVKCFLDGQNCSTFYPDFQELLTELAQFCDKEVLVVITDGANGVYWKTKGEHGFRKFQPEKVENVVDTSCAGDTFVGAFLGSLKSKNEEDVLEAVRTGCETAAKVIQGYGFCL